MFQFIDLKDEKWFCRQKIAGKTVAKCLANFVKNIGNQESISLKDIESECEKIIINNDCTPTFKGYKGFPGSVCLSVNKQLVHGIPSDYKLKSGDVVTLDLGATFEGAIADAATTCIYGQPISKKHTEMITLCKNALDKAISSLIMGRRIGCIGQSIYRQVRNSEFFLIENYGGHGISYDIPHSDPFIANKSKADDGVFIQNGMSIAIEPMLSMKSAKTSLKNDGWTVTTPGINCHEEHSVTIWDDKPYIITDWKACQE